AELARLIGLVTLAAAQARVLDLRPLIERIELHGQLLLLAAAPHGERRFAAGLHAGDDGGQLRRELHLLVVHRKNDVARLHAGFLARAVLHDLTHERATGAVETERIGELTVDVLDADADAATRDVTGLRELIAHVHRNIDRNRERQAHVAAALAEDL